MIVSFSVGNYRSFLKEETLSLVASKRLAGAHEDHESAIPGSQESVLKTAVVYGANGAGKSNLFQALRYLKRLAIETRDKKSGTDRTSFKFVDDASAAPSTFDLQFVAQGSVYRYGLHVDDNYVLQEWLARINGARDRIIYERITRQDGEVVIEAGKQHKSTHKLRALITVGGPSNQTFLATIQANLAPDDVDVDIRNVIGWFTASLTCIAPDETIVPVGHLLANSAEFLEFAGRFLNAASTGVHHLGVSKKELSEEELYKLIPKPVFSKLFNDIEAGQQSKKAVVGIGEGNELLIERGPENHYYAITVNASHAGDPKKFLSLELTEESDGTRRLLNLIPVLHKDKGSGLDRVFVIDEIDRSMHPMLSWEFMRYFLSSCSDDHRQLIVTTHESKLLDLELLRRDEIWFSEKDSDSATRIYSLSDFKVRKDLEIRRHYLQGRFGAVPFLGNIDQLLEEEHNERCGDEPHK